MSPGVSISGCHLVGSSDDDESVPPSPNPPTNPPTPGSPVFPGLVQLGGTGQETGDPEPDPKPTGTNPLSLLMRNSVAHSPSKTRSPLRKRNTPKKRLLQTTQSPNSKKFKQLKMDVFSPAKPTREQTSSPFKIPQSPTAR